MTALFGKNAIPTSRAAAQRYMEDRTATSSPAELVGMLFDAALANIKLGSASLEAGDRYAASRRYLKAQDIVLELRSSLNREAGPLAEQLDSIYAWVFQHLVTAAVSSERSTALAAAREALRCLEPIVAAWAEAMGSRK